MYNDGFGKSIHYWINRMTSLEKTMDGWKTVLDTVEKIDPTSSLLKPIKDEYDKASQAYFAVKTIYDDM